MNLKTKTTLIAIISALSSYSYSSSPAEQVAQAIEEIKIIGNNDDYSPLSQTSNTGSKLGLTILETPASVNIIVSETMRERGFSTTLQALDNVVGVLTRSVLWPGLLFNKGFCRNDESAVFI